MIEVNTRSINVKLYERMSEFIPMTISPMRVDGFNQEDGSSLYLHEILTDEYNTDWLINCDEDCFIFDWNKVEGLINYMQENDYDYAGMPDGGVCRMRARNHVAMNPFFNIFNVKKIREKYTTRQEIDATKLVYPYSKPHFLTQLFDNTTFSPFYPLFFWLRENFKPLYLNARDHPDEFSTILLDHTGKEFALHAWYSREYNRNVGHKLRIDALYEEAKLRKNLNQKEICNI